MEDNVYDFAQDKKQGALILMHKEDKAGKKQREDGIGCSRKQG